MSEALTNRELDVWIAETLFGWERIKDRGVHDDLSNRVGSIWKYDKSPYANQLAIPDYTTDLNVCAQAEAKIGEMALRSFYVEALISAGMGGRFDAICASARQRCNAIYEIREHIEKEKHD